MDACGSAPASGLSVSCFNHLDHLCLALSFLGEVVVHGDTKTHGYSNIFDLLWFFCLDG
jgi:hypothetical protein